ncbi:uncharacterized protein Tco025E_00198 [Trypanosoma conorhini]|uniref:PH domain-containing protein n=1 Tax=Trypanosoma conorhini TaxID=83891 RepID=A0A3R7M6L0_9TRYP|nr:uncharacterized protein Tco025E_00198 [Trypanosoma conorhini]RNF27548.1 hypothetical protein Tco025E_00198 [Trypanosoma conorhini]
MTASAAEHAALLNRLCTEIHLAQQQLRRSREARSTYGVACDNAAACAVGKSPSPPPSPPRDVRPQQEGLSASLPGTAHDKGVSPRAGETRAPPAGAATAARKEGTLLHLERGPLGRERFAPHFVVIDEHKGIVWYQSERHARTAPSRPLGQVPFWKETRNSRGSRFKKAAVCWPLILPDDCPKADDPKKTYFAIEYLNDKGSYSKLVFAAESAEERDDWVLFITQFLEMFLPPRAESEELQHLPRGAAVPRHTSGGYLRGGARRQRAVDVVSAPAWRRRVNSPAPPPSPHCAPQPPSAFCGSLSLPSFLPSFFFFVPLVPRTIACLFSLFATGAVSRVVFLPLCFLQSHRVCACVRRRVKAKGGRSNKPARCVCPGGATRAALLLFTAPHVAPNHSSAHRELEPRDGGGGPRHGLLHALQFPSLRSQSL